MQWGAVNSAQCSTMSRKRKPEVSDGFSGKSYGSKGLAKPGSERGWEGRRSVMVEET